MEKNITSCEKCNNEDSLPCCASTTCESDGKLGICVHCGAAMFKENGFWFHHTQEDIPYDKRNIVHR